MGGRLAAPYRNADPDTLALVVCGVVMCAWVGLVAFIVVAF